MLKICAIFSFVATSFCLQTTEEVCGTSALDSGLIVGGKSFQRGSFPW